MAHRLVVNPGTSQAWEFQLKPGPSRIGRGEQNDVRINHPSVSTVHCEILVSDSGVILKDLGSTNGTFLNGNQVQEVSLHSGQHLQLGSVDVYFEAAVATTGATVTTNPPAATPVAPPVTGATPSPPPVVRVNRPPPPTTIAAANAAPVPVPPAAAPKRPGLSLAKSAPAATVATEVEVPASPPMSPNGQPTPRAPAQGAKHVGQVYCKFHPKTLARFLCEHCNKYFCDLCVNTRAAHDDLSKRCRTCGNACAEVRVHVPAAEKEKGFFHYLPDAFVYPFRGSGIFMVVGGTFLYVILQLVIGLIKYGGLRAFIYAIIGTLLIGGYLCAFFQSIVHTTATGDKELPSMPGVTNIWEDVLVPLFQMIGLSLACFSPVILLAIATLALKQPIFGIAMIPAAVLCCIYFPMAFLAVVILDTILAVNPLLIVPSIIRVPLEYLVTLALLAVVLGIRAMSSVIIGHFFKKGLETPDMSQLFMLIGLWIFLSCGGFYLILVSMRILGMLYVTKKRELGWLSR